MPRFAANLTMLFNEVEFPDRFAAAARAGLRGVEYLFPYAFAPDLLAELLGRHKLKQVLFNLPAGNWAGGERGIACLPDRVSEFRDGVGKAIEYAAALGCAQVNCLAGIAPPDKPISACQDTFVGNLAYAAQELGKNGIRLLIEAINTQDMPRFFLSGTAQALEVIKAVGAANLALQYDVYHMQIMEGNLTQTISRNLAMIAHIQVADVPGRHEPGTGEINYPFLFEQLDRIGYSGWIGCEYKPAGKTEEGLGWFARYREG